MEVVLGLDIGTSSTKAVLVSADGVVIANAQRSHELSLPRPGWAEMDAEGIWWAEVRAVCRELAAAAPGPIVGVGISGNGPDLVLCDKDLHPLRPAILYGIDTRAGAEIDLLTERYGRDAILACCGKHLSSQALGPKLEWVFRNEPDVFQRASHWYGCHSYVVAKLTGADSIDHHSASQCDPLYATGAFGWQRAWAEDICRRLPLPEPVWPSEVVGRVHAEAAAATGLPIGTPVVAGTIDAFAEAFSVGVRSPGDLMLMYGSTMFAVQVLDGYAVSPALWTTAGVEPGTHLLAGGTATAGSVTGWLRQLTGADDVASLAAEAATTPLGADGLLVLPYFAGERTPLFDPRARGVIAGLTLRHTRAHLFRAAYEGIAFGVRQILQAFEVADAPADRIVAVGGGVSSPLWTSIVSDVTGLAQQIPRQAIGACYGDALLAAIGVGLVDADTDWTQIEREVRPDAERSRRYRDLYAVWSELYPATRQTMHALGAWAGDGE